MYLHYYNFFFSETQTPMIILIAIVVGIYKKTSIGEKTSKTLMKDDRGKLEYYLLKNLQTLVGNSGRKSKNTLYLTF